MDLKSSSSKQQHWNLKALAAARMKNNGAQKLPFKLLLWIFLGAKKLHQNSDLILGLSIPVLLHSFLKPTPLSVPDFT